VAQVIATHGLSQRRACGLCEITRRSFRRPPRSDRNQEIRQRLRALAEERRRWGCPMLYQLIRREGGLTTSGSSGCTGKKGCRCDGADDANA
jgi:hypothetical protein